MNLQKLQDRERGKGKNHSEMRKKRQKLIDNDNFLSLFIYHVNEACSNLFESKSSKNIKNIVHNA